MYILLIIALIIALYIRTVDYNYVIDDHVQRQDYPIPPTEAVSPQFYDTKPTKKYRAFVIGMHCVNTIVIYLLWGWVPALLFAVHPMSIWSTAWITGNYYGTTTFFMLIAYYILHQFPNFIGGLVSAGIFTAALYSTFDSISMPFLHLLCFNPWGLLWFLPLAFFLRGKKFKGGLQSRLTILEGKHIYSKYFPFNRISVMTKVVAWYISNTIVPMNVYFFDAYLEHVRDYKSDWDEAHSFDRRFWESLIVCVVTFVLGYTISPVGIVWFFLAVGLHSQFNLLGQSLAQRYIYVGLPGMCIVVGTFLAPHPLIAVFIAGFLACKTHIALPSWKNQEELLKNEVLENPYRGESFATLAQYYISKQRLSEYPRWMINKISSYIRKSVEIEPRSWTNRMNYTAFLMMIGKVDEGLIETDKTIELLDAVKGKQDDPIRIQLLDQKRRFENIRQDMRRRIELENRKEDKKCQK